MLNPAYNQVSLYDINHDIDEMTSSNSYLLFDFFDEYIDLKNLIPFSFYKAYYKTLGRNHDYPLEGMIKSIIISDLLGIPTVNLLIQIIKMSSDFRRFLGFTKSPHKSQFSRFKSVFYNEIKEMFHHIVDFTDPYAHEADDFLASLLITDTTGFELYVKENNPKFFQTILKNAKTYAKTLPKNRVFDPEKYAQGKMPKVSSATPDAKLTYLNGHFGYYRKSVITTNGFGLIRDINFIDSDNEMIENLTPNEIKDVYDAKSLIPVLETYFHLHPNHSYDYFLGDSAFDADDNYAYLHNKSIMPIIPINQRCTSTLPDTKLNDLGVPTCPFDPNLELLYKGIIKSNNRADRSQYICPKRRVKMINGIKYVTLDCDNPCTSSPYGRVKNITTHHNYRYFSAMPRSSDEWIELYKHRTVSERTINQLKSFISIETTKTRNTIALQANVLLAGISQMIAFIILFHSKYAEGPLAIRTLIS